MKLRDLDERNLMFNRNGLVLDQDLNEYRNEDGSVEYVEGISDKQIGQMCAEFVQNGADSNIIYPQKK